MPKSKKWNVRYLQAKLLNLQNTSRKFKCSHKLNQQKYHIFTPCSKTLSKWSQNKSKKHIQTKQWNTFAIQQQKSNLFHKTNSPTKKQKHPYAFSKDFAPYETKQNQKNTYKTHKFAFNNKSKAQKEQKGNLKDAYFWCESELSRV